MQVLIFLAQELSNQSIILIKELASKKKKVLSGEKWNMFVAVNLALSLHSNGS